MIPLASKPMSADAVYWIVRNNIGRRNLNPAQRAALVLQYKPVIAEQAKAQQGKRTDLLQNSAKSKEVKTATDLCQNSDKGLEPIDTKKELAKIAGVSHDMIHKVEKVIAQAPAEVQEKMLSGEMSVNQAYADVRRMERKAEIAENLKSIESQKAKTLQGVYDVIVLDPPWRMQKMGAH